MQCAKLIQKYAVHVRNLYKLKTLCISAGQTITHSSVGVFESRFRTSDNHRRRFCWDFLFVRSWTRTIPKQHIA